MTEYYLADRKAEDRAKTRRPKDERAPLQAKDVKVTLLGDFLLSSGEPQGCDPYNAMQGKSPRDTWRGRHTRR
jgi:hypothetical protein